LVRPVSFIRCLILSGTDFAPVPSVMTEEVFWTRYFFRVYQIEREAERRKALLQGEFLVKSELPPTPINRLGTSDSEDAFSWEDDEEEPSSAPVPANPPLQNPTTTHSPRESSEESYDVVSGRNSGENTKKDVKPAVPADKGAETDEDSDSGDSDWE
jgi:hypothetical protein